MNGLPLLCDRKTYEVAKLADLIAFIILSGDASNDDHGAVTGITTTAARASLDNAATATDDGVIDVFAQDDFSDVQVALEKVRDGEVAKAESTSTSTALHP